MMLFLADMVFAVRVMKLIILNIVFFVKRLTFGYIEHFLNILIYKWYHIY